MAKEAFDRILAGLEDAAAFAEGDETRGKATAVEVPEVDVRELRSRLRMSRETFASRFGLNVETVRQWETKRRQPEGPARTLLRIIDREPDAAMRALG